MIGDTFFFFSHNWGAEEDKPATFGWAIARLRDGMSDGQYGAYEITGPFPTYDETVSAWRDRPN